MQNGANIHTINKAIFYLHRLKGENLEKHIKNCKTMINGGPVSVMAYVMQRWF